MMKVNYFVSLWTIAFLTVDNFVDAVPSTEAKLTITPENEQPIDVHLKQVKSFLANENVPMWIIEDKKLRQLNSKKVMLDLGRFTTFQDATTSSAAVYFHKHQEFDGTIDIRYVIRDFSIPNSIHGSDNNEQQNVNHVENHQAIFEREEWGHAKNAGVQNNIEWTFPNVVSEWSGKKLSIGSALTETSCRHNQKTFYIETLVIVNFDLAKKLMIEYRRGLSTIVSYLLTLFNSVDMLFSKIKSPKIKLNIAGIIIGKERESIPYITRCYKKIEKFNRTVEAIDVICANKYINYYLSGENMKIPYDSYDNTIFLTRYPIYEYEYNKETEENKVVHIVGYTLYFSGGLYEYKKIGGEFHPTIFAEDFAYFGSVPIIAHEMVHALGVGEHDDQIDMQDGICCNFLMKADSGFCQNCLDWSNPTKVKLEAIFRSPDGCIFRNKPRSLYPPRPRSIFTADEQCQCYHYVSAQSSRQTLWDTIHTHFWGYCKAYLQCKGRDGKISSAPVPMDGTPCDENTTSNKVCWNRSCIEISNRK